MHVSNDRDVMMWQMRFESETEKPSEVRDFIEAGREFQSLIEEG